MAQHTMADKLYREFVQVRDREVRRMVSGERAFLRNQGARDAVYALVRAEAIDPTVAAHLKQWLESGGTGRLMIHDVAIVPPEEP